MKNARVYDIPTRLFHWLFALLFLTAFGIGKWVDDDAPQFSWHMLAGLTITFLVLLRIIWGIVGTKHARFSDFSLHPRDLSKYFQSILSGEKIKWLGHNPASSWAAILMLLFALGLGTTGFLMTSGANKEDYEDIHELLANGFAVTVMLHIAGIILHTIRHKEMIGLSMVTGRKSTNEGSDEKSRPLVGIFLIALLALFALNLFQNYDAQTRKLNLFGTVLTLGESEEGEKKEGAKGDGGVEDKDDD